MCQECGCTPCKKCGREIKDGVCSGCGKNKFVLSTTLRNYAIPPHCLRWGGMASLLGGLGDRFPQYNRSIPYLKPRCLRRGSLLTNPYAKLHEKATKPS